MKVGNVKPNPQGWPGDFAVADPLAGELIVALADAGAFAVEIEVVPHSITQAIATAQKGWLLATGARRWHREAR